MAEYYLSQGQVSLSNHIMLHEMQSRDGTN